MDIVLIAEIGHNWVPKFEDAVRMISQVRDAGWDVAKFQAYDTNMIKQPGDTNYDELKEAELSWRQLEILKSECDKRLVEFGCSAFDAERLGWLEMLEVKRHKVASRCIFDEELLRQMEETGKQVIASLAFWKEPWFPDWGFDYLYCVTRREILSRGFNHIRFPRTFGPGPDSYTGFSDHTVGNDWAKKAMDRGAAIIEKHVTFDKNRRGWDQPGSADLNDMREIYTYKQELISRRR